MTSTEGSGEPARAAGGPASPGPARIALFAGAAVLLLVLVLAAATTGPWTGRPVERVTETRTTAPPTAPPVSVPSRDLTDRPPPESTGSSPVLWLLLCGVLLVLTYLLVRALAARRGGDPAHGLRGGPPTAVDAVPPAPPEPQQAAVGRGFDPRAAADAIISSWVWVEQWADDRGAGRRAHETPTEFLERVVGLPDGAPADGAGAGDDGAAARAGAAAVLLPLYQRARFDVSRLAEDSALRARDAALLLAGAARRGSGP